MLDLRSQHRHNATLQRQWAALANRDAIYNHNRAVTERKAGNPVLARQYEREEQDDIAWRDKRIRIANRELKLAGGIR